MPTIRLILKTGNEDQIDTLERKPAHSNSLLSYCKEMTRNVTEDVILYVSEGPLYENSQENFLSSFPKINSASPNYPPYDTIYGLCAWDYLLTLR